MSYRVRRVTGLILIALGGVMWILQGLITQLTPFGKSPSVVVTQDKTQTQIVPSNEARAIDVLETLAVKGRAPKTGYERVQFGNGWLLVGRCDTRNIILNRDLSSVVVNEECKVTSGVLDDPYTGANIVFARGKDTSSLVQIDHVVALSDAWQKGAQLLTFEQRIQFANDPLELLAVDGSANQAKGDGDAATWLPANKAFRCQYVARQIAVKAKYALWVTDAEKQAMQKVLTTCPDQRVPTVGKAA